MGVAGEADDGEMESYCFSNHVVGREATVRKDAVERIVSFVCIHYLPPDVKSDDDIPKHHNWATHPKRMTIRPQTTPHGCTPIQPIDKLSKYSSTIQPKQ